MVICRIILLAMLACFAASRHVVPRRSNYFTVDKYVGTWFTLAIATNESVLFDYKCFKTVVSKPGGDHQNFMQIVTAISTYRGITSALKQRQYGNIIDDVMNVRSRHRSTFYKVSKLNNGQQYIMQETIFPYHHRLMSRFRTAPESVIDEFKKSSADSNKRSIKYYPTDNCNIDSAQVSSSRY